MTALRENARLKLDSLELVGRGAAESVQCRTGAAAAAHTRKDTSSSEEASSLDCCRIPPPHLKRSRDASSGPFMKQMIRHSILTECWGHVLRDTTEGVFGAVRIEHAVAH